MSPRSLTFWAVFVVGFAADQLTKAWIYTSLAYRTDEIVLIPGFLSFIHAQNEGAAFGMMSDVAWRQTFFLGFAVVATIVLAITLRGLRTDDRLTAGSIGMIVAGALGNAADRLHKGSVTDFVKVYADEGSPLAALGAWEYPTWNVADALLIVGVGVFLLRAAFVDDEDDALLPDDGDTA